MSQTHDASPVTQIAQPLTQVMSRRSVLKTMIAGSSFLVGGAALAACGGETKTAAQDVTLITSGWPIDVPQSKEMQQKDPRQKAYADTLQIWLNKNPGVKIKKVTTDVWDQTKLNTAISTGTVPHWYPGNVVGGWNDTAIRNSYVRGMAIDLNDLIKKYNTDKKIAPYVQETWKRWAINGKQYALPHLFFAGDFIYYRRDLVQELGLQEPTPKSTWQDIQVLAKGLTSGKRRGIAIEQARYLSIANANKASLFSQEPAPDVPWRWKSNVSGNIKYWQEAADIWRTMRYKDKSLSTDVTYTGDEVFKQFVSDSAAMFLMNSNFYTGSPRETGSMSAFAFKKKKDLKDMVGLITLPVGTNGAFGEAPPFIMVSSFSPLLVRQKETLDKAYSVLDYMHFGQGYIDQKKGVYEATKDIRDVYDFALPVNGFTSVPGVPGSSADAWGERYTNALLDATKIPLVPNPAWYFPPEKNGPTETAQKDALSGIAATEKDIKGILATWDRVTNADYRNFTSSLSPADFKKAAQTYYSDHAKLWQQHAPEFYENDFKPWYEQKVLPVIG